MLTRSREGKNTRPIAIVEGGKHHGTIIFINPDLKRNNNDEILKDYIHFSSNYDNEKVYIPRDKVEEKMMFKLSKMKKSSMKKGSKLLEQVEREAEEEINKEMDDVIGDGDFFILSPYEDSKLVLLPNTKRNDIIVAFGSAGAGKSSLANSFAEEFRQVFPDNPIYLFSRVKKDDSIDEKKNQIDRINIDKHFLTFKMNYNDLNNSLVIFDDIDGMDSMFASEGKMGKLAGKFMSEKVIGMQNDIIHLGRQHDAKKGIGIYCFNIRHVMYDKAKTRELHNGSNLFIIFPQHLLGSHVDRFLKEEVGCDKEMCKKLKSVRWFAYSRAPPKYVVSEKFIYLL